MTKYIYITAREKDIGRVTMSLLMEQVNLEKFNGKIIIRIPEYNYDLLEPIKEAGKIKIYYSMLRNI